MYKNVFSLSQIIDDDDFNEFIYQPTPLSGYFKSIVKNLHARELKNIQQSFFYKIVFQIKVFYYLKISHVSIFKKLKKLKTLFINKTASFTLHQLSSYFTEVQKLLMINNLSLSVFYVQNKSKIENNLLRAPFSFEEQSKFFLQITTHTPSSIQVFKQKFGYYSDNNYELASRRFDEYSDKEIIELANSFKNLSVRIKNDSFVIVDQFTDDPTNDQEVYSNILVIRDLAKDVSIKIIALLREQILELAKNYQITNPFQKEWDDLLLKITDETKNDKKTKGNH